MRVNYNGLWALVKKNKMTKADLINGAEISNYSFEKLRKNEFVSLEVLVKACKLFHCDLSDIVEVSE